jgi:hypothetical protein
MTADCGAPPDATMAAAPPAVLVSVNVAGVPTPATEAVTAYVPVVPFAVKTPDVATPEAFVTAVFAPPAKLPLAPDGGAAKVTVTPATGLPFASLTVAASGSAKAVFAPAVCPDPLVAVMDAGACCAIVSVRVRVAVSAGEPESVTRNVSDVLVIEPVGVPLISPVDVFRLRPFGSVPAVSAHV